jgi:hypothetical protein
MADRTTKILLAAIALGLWANVITGQIQPAAADAWTFKKIERHLDGIERHLNSIESNFSSLTSGLCLNSKLC